MQIDARNLALSRGDHEIVSDISAVFRSGERCAIVGPNGAGKTTLLHLLTGFLAPDRGQVCLGGVSISTQSSDQLARWRAVCEQEHHTLFALSVLEVVRTGRYIYQNRESPAEATAIARQALQAVDATEFEARGYLSLSGGEKQLVQIARGLAQIWSESEGFLFLDEPTNNLDIPHQHHVMRLLATFQERGVGSVVVLHDLNLALRYCDRVLFLANGKLVADGTPEAVLQPETVKAFMHVDTVTARCPNGLAQLLFLG